MTREEIEELIGLAASMGLYDDKKPCKRAVILGKAIKALQQQPCEDAISKKEVIDTIYRECSYENLDIDFAKVLLLQRKIKALPPVNPQLQPKIGHCRECKWWKDSDGVFRRGIDAESQCPMNRIEVYEGDGYCFMFESQESEE